MPLKWTPDASQQLPLHADLFIQDCLRQDLPQFGGQYVWTVQIRLWRGPEGHYPRLADPQFNCSFDIPADWASNGWYVPYSMVVTVSTEMSQKQRQAQKCIDMMNRPGEAAAHLIKVAMENGILDGKTRLVIDVL